MRWMFLTCLVLAFGNASAQQALSLQQCIQLAWERNLQIQQASLSLESIGSNLQSAKSNRLPNLNGFASHNYNWGQRIDPFTNLFANTRVQSNSFGLSSDVTLFSGFQIQNTILAQQAQFESVYYDLEAQKNDVALRVSAAFLNVMMAEELTTGAEQQVQITRRQLERIQALVAAGSTNVGVQYDLEAQLARDRTGLVRQQNAYTLAILQLKQLINLPATEEVTFVVPENLVADSTIRLENAATVYAYAEGAMPEIKRAEKSLVRWENQMKAAQGARYPTLSLSGSIGTGYSGLRTEVTSVTATGFETIGITTGGESVLTPTYNTEVQRVAFGTQLSDNFNQFLGLSLSVPIFNRGNVNNSIDQARINRQIAELQLEVEKQQLRQKIETARNDAYAARELLKASQSAVTAAAKAFEFAEVRFEAGAMNTTDFNIAKNNLQIAQADLANARYDYLFKLKVLDFYMGKPITGI